ncbi:hypothetical protein NL509_27015, partial [Klebsiella pneumoniae]|nr:hypothetical protein [Klebsiella pneumoniae]
ICGLPSMVSVVMFEAELTTVSTLTRLRFMLGPHWWISGNKKGRCGGLRFTFITTMKMGRIYS